MTIHLQLFYHFVCAENVVNLRCFTGNLGCVGRKLEKLKSPGKTCHHHCHNHLSKNKLLSNTECISELDDVAPLENPTGNNSPSNICPLATTAPSNPYCFQVNFVMTVWQNSFSLFYQECCIYGSQVKLNRAVKYGRCTHFAWTTKPLEHSKLNRYIILDGPKTHKY